MYIGICITVNRGTNVYVTDEIVCTYTILRTRVCSVSRAVVCEDQL